MHFLIFTFLLFVIGTGSLLGLRSLVWTVESFTEREWEGVFVGSVVVFVISLGVWFQVCLLYSLINL